MPKVTVITPGLQTTVQDLGRPAYQIAGFPASGSIDRLASRLANLLVGNNDQAAVLEFSLMGGELAFTGTTFVAFTGGNFLLELNGKPFAANQAHQVHSGDRLKIGTAKQGRYGYLAVAGGILEPLVMGSQATTIRVGVGGHHGRALKSGDQLPIIQKETLSAYAFRKSDSIPLPQQKSPLKIRVVKGPQWSSFDSAAQHQFLAQIYQVSNQTDRMGTRLIGQPLQTGVANMLSEATVSGGIQISSDGQPIVLLADRQTTGGYPVIAVVITADLPKFVQSRDRQLIQFELTDLTTAHEALAAEHQWITRLKQRFNRQRFKQPIEKNRAAAQRIQKLF